MRILWLSTLPGLMDVPQLRNSYNGGGWIASLQRLLCEVPDCELAIAFPTHIPIPGTVQNGTAYYPLYSKAPSGWDKLKLYYGGYKHRNSSYLVRESQEVEEDFKPDVIHIFGIENPFANALGHLKAPVVVHLQGLLGPCDNAFYPQALNKSSFVLPFSVREWIIHNGYIFAKNSMHERGKWEKDLFSFVRHAMGRTAWDRQVLDLFAPDASYTVVNEVLRDVFYAHAGAWLKGRGALKDVAGDSATSDSPGFDSRIVAEDGSSQVCPPAGKFTVISTVSQTIYKGLDLILKAAKLLKETTAIDFEWKVVGINGDSQMVRYFERSLKISSAAVNLRYLGILDADRLCSELLQSDVYVHPSYIDNSPNSVCEAQLLGLPVIATYVGGVPSLVEHGVSGLLIPSNAPYELAYYLKILATGGDSAASVSAGAASSSCQLSHEAGGDSSVGVSAGTDTESASSSLSQRLGWGSYIAASCRHDKKQIVKDLLAAYRQAISASE